MPGQVKTRLIPALGANGAMATHSQMVSDALALLQSLGELELHTDIATDAWPQFTGTRQVQTPGDLGRRMLAALSTGRVMIAGSDAPGVPLPHYRELIDAEADVSLGPTEDGGFYAICARRTHTEMFDGVEWSSGKELRQTIQACERCGLTVHLGSRWFDIDTPEDLERARAAGIL